MAGKRKRKLKSLADTIRSQQCPIADLKKEEQQCLVTEPKEQEQLELQSWSDLPAELLENVLSLLTLKENFCVSAVCKRWNAVAVSVRVINQPPWIMYFPKYDDVYEFYDPFTRKTYTTVLKELSGSTVCHTKDGWLLLYTPATYRVFFFNPFTREVIELPSLEMTHQIVAFSCAPTDPSCVVFTVKHVSPAIIAISTCYPGATEWLTANFHNHLPFIISTWNKLVFCDGFFYCLSLTGWLGVFDPKELTWKVLVVPPPRCPENFFSKHWWKGKFLVVHNGEIYVIYTCYSENPAIFKLDQSAMAWEEIESLDGVTLFASFLSSNSRTDLPGMMRNSIFFSKVLFYGKRCVSYSLKDRRYYPRKQWHDWAEQDPFECLWIDPPKDLSAFIEGH